VTKRHTVCAISAFANLAGVFLTFILCSSQAYAQAYTHAHLAKVGYVQISGGGNGGLAVWGTADGSSFPGCTSNPQYMWTDNAPTVTVAASKSMLAVALTAKAMDRSVWAYYIVDSGGNCIARHLGIN